MPTRISRSVYADMFGPTTGDRPIQVGSHYHFETNPALKFDRKKARGVRLDIACRHRGAVRTGTDTRSATRGAVGQENDLRFSRRRDGEAVISVGAIVAVLPPPLRGNVVNGSKYNSMCLAIGACLFLAPIATVGAAGNAEERWRIFEDDSGASLLITTTEGATDDYDSHIFSVDAALE
jgi:hypothetical protein